MAQMLTCMDDMSAPPPPPQQQEAGGDRAEGEAGAGTSMVVDETQPGGKDFTPHPHVIVIGATNRPDSLDPALRWVWMGGKCEPPSIGLFNMQMMTSRLCPSMLFLHFNPSNSL